MKHFEVTGAGLDGDSDETDDRVLWVSAPDQQAVENAIAGLGADVVPLGQTVDEQEIDFHLPAELAEIRAVLLNFQNLEGAQPAPAAG